MVKRVSLCVFVYVSLARVRALTSSNTSVIKSACKMRFERATFIQTAKTQLQNPDSKSACFAIIVQ